MLDPAGLRIGRKVGGALERGWLYAGGLLPVAETDADGHTVRRVFVYATRPNVPDLVQQLEGGAWVTYRVLVDHLGSVRSVVRASDGALVQRMDYDAFGVVLDDWSASGWVRIPFGFAGGLYDRETGLVRFGAREYDAPVGRWVSRDPILFGGGDSNLYAYVSNDPINGIDPTGLFVDGAVAARLALGTAGIVGGALLANPWVIAIGVAVLVSADTPINPPTMTGPTDPPRGADPWVHVYHAPRPGELAGICGGTGFTSTRYPGGVYVGPWDYVRGYNYHYRGGAVEVAIDGAHYNSLLGSRQLRPDGDPHAASMGSMIADPAALTPSSVIRIIPHPSGSTIDGMFVY